MNRVSVIGVTQKTNMNYISATKKKLVGRNNQVCTSPIVLDYSTTEDVQFQLIDEKNQIQPVSGLTGLYFAGSLGVGQQSYDLLFLSKDFTVSEDVITFRVDTYTRNYLDKIKKKGTEINIEIGQISLDVKRVILRDYALAMPRVYVAGLSPQEIESNDYYTKEEVDGLIRAVQPPTKLSELENDKGFVDSAYVTGAVSGKLDAPSGGTAGQVLTKTEAGEEWASAPTKLSELENDKGFVDSAYVTGAVSGKLDAPSGGTAGQVLTKTETGEEWGEAAQDTKFVSVEEKTLGASGAYEVDFVNGKKIQKYSVTDFARGTAKITLASLDGAPADSAPTVELQLPVFEAVETLSIPSSLNVISMPESLEGGEEQRDKIKYKYHDIVFRAEKDFNGEWRTYVNYAYSFDENRAIEDTRDYFWIKPLEDGSTISCGGFNASYSISSSFDRVNWTALTGATIASGVAAGTKVYLIGNTPTLGSDGSSAGFTVYCDKSYSIGGKVFSLFSDLLKPKTLTNQHDLNRWQSGKANLRECSVDFGPVSGFSSMFSSCSSLSGLPDGFSWPNATNTRNMFYGCSSLSGLPDGFSCPNTTDTGGMFANCSKLSGLPDGFSCPNATSTDSMFHYCSRLSGLPDGFSCPNTTHTGYMFNSCSNLSGLPDGFSCPNATNTGGMFAYCYSLSGLPDGFSCPNTTNTGEMFYSCSNLSGLPDGFSCPNATNTSNMLNGCSSLSGLPDGFSCPNATDTGYMFNNCSRLSGLPDGFSCPNTTNTNQMFSSCSRLSRLPDGFSCPNTTNTRGMFRDCSSLSGLPDGFSCPEAADTLQMFSFCSSLTRLPDGFSCPNATNTNGMFRNCSSLSGLPDGFSCPNTTDTGEMFTYCPGLSGLPDGFSAPNVTDANNMFSDCSSLTTIGSNVKIANGASASSTDNTALNKSQITTIGDNFEWFTNATYSGTWDPALGIKNVFPNATAGSGWKVYNHHDGE